jgi:1-acyl-sn-glycerol-3-phosphate acyltransferase
VCRRDPFNYAWGHAQWQWAAAVCPSRGGVIGLEEQSPCPSTRDVWGEKYKNNLKKLRRTDFYIALGKRFTLKVGNGAVDSQARKQMLDELMYQMAALLPPEYRGVYANLPDATQNYLEFC